MSGTPFLNHDTIREILSHLPQSACASLMRTCRFFYHEAGRFIARDGVILRKAEKIVSFTLFILGEDRSRCLSIRKLRIEHCYDDAENALRLLSLCLHYLTSLTSLTVSGDVLFKISPPFAIAVAQLTSLLHLEISGVGHLSCFILQTVQSKQLRSIKLGWLTYDDMEPHEIQKIEYHPVALLSRWTSSLESLACDAWFTSLELPAFPHVYPKMRKLSIDWDELPLIAPYIRAYPNLKCIDFRAGDVVDWKSDEDMIRAHHELNVRSQSIAGTRWEELDRVDGSLIDFYILGLVCPISRVSLIRTGIQSEDDLEILSELLAYARPKELRIEGDFAYILHADNSFSELLRTAAGSRLENLLLHIDLSKSDREIDIAAALERLGASLRMCPLRRLRLCVRAGMLHFTPVQPLRPLPHTPVGELPLNLAKRSLLAFDIDAYSRELGSAIPSLTDAVFVIAGHLGESERLLSYIPPRHGVDDTTEEWTVDWKL